MVQQVSSERLEGDQLLRQLRERRNSVEMQWLIRLLQIQLEVVKDRLVKVPFSEFQHFQGQATAYTALINQLTRDDPLKKPE